MPEEQSPVTPEEERAITPQEAVPAEVDDIPIPQEVLERLPAGARQRLIQSFTSATTIYGPPRNPLLDKLNADHISSLISAADKDRDRALEDRKHSRKWLAVLVALIFIPIALLLGYFAFLQQNTLVLEIIKLVAVGAGGFFGGYGYGFARWRGRR